MPKKDIAELLGISETPAYVNSPYLRNACLAPNKTVNVLRVRKCNEKRNAAAAKKLPEWAKRRL